MSQLAKFPLPDNNFLAGVTLAEAAERLRLHKSGTVFRGTCPCCEYAADTLIVKRNKGQLSFYCVNCADGRDLYRAVMKTLGGEIVTQPRAPQPAAGSEGRIAEAQKRLAESLPIAGTPVEKYLTRRGLAHLIECEALRYHPECKHPQGSTRLPAMLAPIVQLDGTISAVHQTFLTYDGRKTSLEPAKASKGIVTGGAIRLAASAAEIVVGEGIESSAAAGKLLGLPAWAAVSCGNMWRSLKLPPEVRSVVIAADHDYRTAAGHEPGQEAAAGAAKRWAAEGRKVRIALPDQAGTDFNDLLIGAQNG